MPGQAGESTPVFDSLPSGLDIAHWFREEAFARRFRNVGGDATWLCDDPLSTLWLVATVDHDEQMFYLLDITTEQGERTTHDLLLVTAGLREPLACEWRNEPSERQPWGAEALHWFANRIEAIEEAGRWNLVWFGTDETVPSGRTGQPS